MIVTYNWLKEFVDIDCAPRELADTLTMLGLEVEGMHPLGGGMDDVVVALVEERAQHPNADKLSLCRVNNGREILSVVCGAQNFKAGDKVALAQIGATLPGDFKIKRSKIRGEESFGMLCSEKELALAEESSGIMVLPAEFPLGVPLFDALGLKDTVFEIGLTPNRADCLSVLGIAREVAAKLDRPLRQAAAIVEEKGEDIAGRASVTIDAPNLCPRYTARLVTGCTIAPSPAWLVNRLNAVGMRAINNVVDITNYVLMELGHPLHAFDYDLLAGRKIVVRRAQEGEKLTTLDGQEHALQTSDLTICDGEKIVALAGIMGGGNSEIRDCTVNILLESAWFNPTAVRKTSKRLGLHTESSHRFERGADIDLLTRALDRAASLIAELAGGTVARGTIDVYPAPATPRTIRLRTARVNQVLGIDLAPAVVEAICRRLSFAVSSVEPGVFDVTVPLYRVDLEREIDLVEEVARLHGFENIPTTMPVAEVISDLPTVSQRLEKGLRDMLVAQGFNEVINFSFSHEGALDQMLLPADDPRRRTVKLLNPLAEEHAQMRTMLLPGLLETAAKNLRYRNSDLRLFEMRRVYLPVEGEELPVEPLHLACLITGRRAPEGWNQDSQQADFFDIKGVVENILAEFKITGAGFDPEQRESYYHPGKSCAITLGTTVAGSLGEIHPDVQDRFGIEQPVYCLELDLAQIMRRHRAVAPIVPPPRFPDITRDVALLMDDALPSAEVIAAIRRTKAKELADVEIFDLYKGEHLTEGKKSLAVRLRYRSAERTLTDEEVNRLHQRIVDSLVSSLNVSLR